MVGLIASVSLSLLLPASAELDIRRSKEPCDPHNEITGIDAEQVWTPGDDGFDDARLDQYARFLGTSAQASAKLNPAMLVSCTEEAHVQSAIKFAGVHGYKVTVRSGGHSYTGSSSCNAANCMQLDLQHMNKTSVKGRMITAQPGLRLIDFAKLSVKHFLSVPHGGCTRVGLGGHMQSSAWGMMSHSWGSGLDHVESFRMVLADGSVGQYSRNDTNDTVYKSVLGSAPGSWGVVTEYQMSGVPDTAAPLTRMIVITILWSRANVLAAMKQTQFVMQDQEKRGDRDMKILTVIAPPTEDVDDEVFIKVYGLWSGIDHGIMGPSMKKLYLDPFWALEHKSFPESLDVPMTLSGATRLFVDMWTNHDDHYAVEAFHSDHWWSDEFLEIIADELEERVQMIPDVYPSFQFLPLGQSTQWSRNAGMNALTWRDTRQYVDDWMFVKNESRYEEVVQRMRGFRERTRKYWESSDGSDRFTWMSPMTIYENATDLRIPAIAKGFFPNQTQFEELQVLKSELDPSDMFSNKGTIPLPGDMYAVV